MRIYSLILAVIFVAIPSLSMANQFFGHWPAGSVTEPARHGQFSVGNDPGAFHFTVADWSISSFLECAALQYPDNDVFLYGYPKKDNSGVVNSAFICLGEINLSNCEPSSRVYSCTSSSSDRLLKTVVSDDLVKKTVLAMAKRRGISCDLASSVLVNQGTTQNDASFEIKCNCSGNNSISVLGYIEDSMVQVNEFIFNK